MSGDACTTRAQFMPVHLRFTANADLEWADSYPFAGALLLFITDKHFLCCFDLTCDRSLETAMTFSAMHARRWAEAEGLFPTCPEVTLFCQDAF